jgi:hypothetical protein
MSMLTLALGLANQANAEEEPWVLFASLDPGLACEGFGLDVSFRNCSENRPEDKVFTDEYGNPVRILSRGKGCDLKFENQSTDAAFFTKADGSVSHTRFNIDGSQTVSTGGHNVLIFFPSDLPPGVGPSTRQYVGRVVYTVDVNETWTLEKVSGRTVDICAELSE